jgi:lipopolysaccharide transport system permease protein
VHTSDKVRVNKPTRGWRNVDIAELWEYRDLYSFLIWRDIKVRYAQSVLGVGWAVIQPLVLMIVFTVIFGRLVEVNSDGAPYPVFSYSGLVPWTYFSTAIIGATGSLTAAGTMLDKVYFPRLVLPMAPVLSRLIDFAIAMLLLFALMVWYGISPTMWILTLPLLVFLMMLAAAGIGMWLTALAVQFRDINYGLPLVLQLVMYASPVVYPTSAVPEQYRIYYALNPVVGVVEGFRSALIDTIPMPWDLLAIGTAVSAVLFATGILYFRRMERKFADVI